MEKLNRFKNALVYVGLIVVVGVLSGCHAAKGLGRDIKESTTTAGEHIQQADGWIQEHMW